MFFRTVCHTYNIIQWSIFCIFCLLGRPTRNFHVVRRCKGAAGVYKITWNAHFDIYIISHKRISKCRHRSSCTAGDNMNYTGCISITRCNHVEYINHRTVYEIFGGPGLSVKYISLFRRSPRAYRTRLQRVRYKLFFACIVYQAFLKCSCIHIQSRGGEAASFPNTFYRYTRGAGRRCHILGSDPRVYKENLFSDHLPKRVRETRLKKKK